MNPKEALLQALGVDGALTVPQAHRPGVGGVAGLNTCLRDGLVAVKRRYVRPTGYSRATVAADVVALTPAGREVARALSGRPVETVNLEKELEHRLGVAEVRSRLGVAPEAWTTALELHLAHIAGLHGEATRGLPDALADLDGTRLAVEYDHGRYTARQVRLKQAVFPQLADRAVWAVPTARRAEWLARQDCRGVLVVPLPTGTG